MRSRIIGVGSSTRRNRVGRAHSLWLTARAAGLDFRYLTVADGEWWEPVREDRDFLAVTDTVASVAALERRVEAELDSDSVIVVCKPRPELLRMVQSFTARVPVIVDVDDPELIDPWAGASMLLRAKRVVRLGPEPFRFGWARRALRTMPVLTSNPLLQARYGGALVPHVREVGPEPSTRSSAGGPFVVAFVGTVREHKGIDELRAAVRALTRTHDVTLRVTAEPPADAEPWEEWVGPTSLARGRELLAHADAAAVLSRPGVWGDLQLPAKLVDAMAAGVPAVTTPRPPLLWAAGGASVVVRDGSAADLTGALALLADDPALAEDLSTAAWNRARTTFTPEAVAGALAAAVERADADHRRGAA
jgi:glycosyltransferase involved in cell wall biosynthesis